MIYNPGVQGEVLARDTNLGVFIVNMMYKPMRTDEVNQSMGVEKERRSGQRTGLWGTPTRVWVDEKESVKETVESP